MVIEILDAKEALGGGELPPVVLDGIAAAAALPLAVRENPSKKYRAKSGSNTILRRSRRYGFPGKKRESSMASALDM